MFFHHPEPAPIYATEQHPSIIHEAPGPPRNKLVRAAMFAKRMAAVIEAIEVAALWSDDEPTIMRLLCDAKDLKGQAHES